MHRAVIKPVLFLATWYECAVELGIGGTAAFVVALLIWSGFRFLLGMIGQAIGLLGPRGVRLAMMTALWVGLFWWFAPAAILNAPLFLVAAGIGVLVLAGAKCREIFEARRGIQQDHPPGAILAIMIGLVAAAMALWPAVPLLPLIGVLLLPGLPFGIGWQLVRPGSPARTDARFGEGAAFRDAGFSEDR